MLLCSKMKFENCILFSCSFSPRETNRVAHALARCIEHAESFETGMEKGPKDRFVSSLYLRMMFLRVCLMNCFWFKKKNVGEVIQSLDSGIVSHFLFSN